MISNHSSLTCKILSTSHQAKRNILRTWHHFNLIPTTQCTFSSAVLELPTHLCAQDSQKEQQFISQIMQKYLLCYGFIGFIKLLINAFAESNSEGSTNKGNCRREADVLMAALS